MEIPVINIRKRKILEEELLADYESGPLWVVDNDAKRGRELNFKIYDDLAGQYEIYLDGEFRHKDDISDGITMGASNVTISEQIEDEAIRELLSITESMILYYRGDDHKIEIFRDEGGLYVYSDSTIPEGMKQVFTRKISCDNCILLIDIGEYNGRRDKETDLLPQKNTG
ncbi:MAG: hypothetical protein M1515_03210 [Candidatus Thermoplasmatota archaeon]|jgi:hypothetical protein|nr:hypothetical protein [Candidatus Thermoplasmatota archaeon]